MATDHEASAPSWIMLIGHLRWPMVALIALYLFQAQVKGVLDRSTEFTVGPNGLSVKKAVDSAVSAISASQGGQGHPQAPLTSDAPDRVTHTAIKAANNAQKLSRSSVLWVDDNPENNQYLERSISQLGIDVTTVRTTAEAVAEYRRNPKYDLVVTDMGRGVERLAGLQTVAEFKGKVPLVVYSGSWSGSNLGKEDQFGVGLITNDPTRVYEYVVDTLIKK